MSNMTLNKYAGYAGFPGPVVTVVMDGMGIGPEDESNGIYLAYTPQLDELADEAGELRVEP